MVVIKSQKDLQQFLSNNLWIDGKNFTSILLSYEFPIKNFTIVVDQSIIEIFIIIIGLDFIMNGQDIVKDYFFHNIHNKDDFFYTIERLNEDFSGVIVTRPSYGDDVNKMDHTFRQTLLTPYKMVVKNVKN